MWVTATPADLPELVELGAAMHAESRYHRYPFDAAQLEAVIASVLPQGLTFYRREQGRIVAAFVGRVSRMWFSSATVARDLGQYVVPERRGRLGGYLIREYVRRARAAGVDEIEIGSTVEIGDYVRVAELYGFLGFRPVGGFFVLDEDAHVQRPE